MLHSIKTTAIRLWNDESGASLLEYSVLVGLITAGVVGTVMAVSAMDRHPLDHPIDDAHRLAELISALYMGRPSAAPHLP